MSNDNHQEQRTFWQEPVEKRCAKCKELKALTEFGIHQGRPRSYCRECRRVRPGSPRHVLIKDRGEKRCAGCRATKPLKDFYYVKPSRKYSDGQYSGYCRPCNTKICCERHRVKIASGEATLLYKEVYKTKRWKKLLDQYGLTREQYEAIEVAQQGLCAICEQPETAVYKDVLCRLVVDHDHATNKVRGLLCRACNLAVGNFRDDPERLLKAIAYLRKHGL